MKGSVFRASLVAAMLLTAPVGFAPAAEAQTSGEPVSVELASLFGDDLLVDDAHVPLVVTLRNQLARPVEGTLEVEVDRWGRRGPRHRVAIDLPPRAERTVQLAVQLGSGGSVEARVMVGGQRLGRASLGLYRTPREVVVLLAESPRLRGPLLDMGTVDVAQPSGVAQTTDVGVGVLPLDASSGDPRAPRSARAWEGVGLLVGTGAAPRTPRRGRTPGPQRLARRRGADARLPAERRRPRGSFSALRVWPAAARGRLSGAQRGARARAGAGSQLPGKLRPGPRLPDRLRRRGELRFRPGDSRDLRRNGRALRLRPGHRGPRTRRACRGGRRQRAASLRDGTRRRSPRQPGPPRQPRSQRGLSARADPRGHRPPHVRGHRGAAELSLRRPEGGGRPSPWSRRHSRLSGASSSCSSSGTWARAPPFATGRCRCAR